MSPRIVLLTGLSGSGKSTAAKCFEDAGYYCVDNMPLQLLDRLMTDHESLLPEHQHIAIVTDVRSPGFVDGFPKVLDRLEKAVLMFLEASDDTLVRRFSETRRPHPLGRDSTVIDAIRAERELLAPLRARADVVVDTGEWSVHDLRHDILGRYAEKIAEDLIVSVTSFGYKFGIPKGADLLFDVRFLPNPHFVEGLREKTGRDPEVRDFLEAQDDYDTVRAKLVDFMSFLLPRYQSENRSYLTVGIGCTGGKHRSVAMAEALAEAIRSQDCPVQLNHRDIGRE